MLQPEEMVSTAAAALILGKTRMQIRYLIKTGQLQAERQGERWLVYRQSVEQLRSRPEDRPFR